MQKEQVEAIQLELKSILDAKLQPLIGEFPENSQLPNCLKLMAASLDIQGAINKLGKVIESFSE